VEMLKMTDISKSFFGVPVLQHVDFNVEQGEIHALLGENGAGKSTLMNILAGVYTRDSGTVIFDGEKLEHTTVNLLRRRVSPSCIRSLTCSTISEYMRIYFCVKKSPKRPVC